MQTLFFGTNTRLALALGATLTTLLAIGLGCAESQTVASAAKPIAWQTFSGDVFALAEKTHRVVLLDVGIEGCTACRHMYESTYADPAVRELVNANFIPVAVDADTQPDLGQRYVQWGWPATIFLSPKGKQLRAVAGSKTPKHFVTILNQVMKNASQPNAAEAVAPEENVQVATSDDLSEMCAKAVARLDRNVAKDGGGWGKGPVKHPRAQAVEHAFLRAAIRNDAARQAHALKSTQGAARLIDDVWGGAYVASFTSDWRSPIWEKRTITQSGLLENFASAYRESKDPVWLDNAAELERYLDGFMRAPGGGYYATQEDAVVPMPANLSLSEYYAKDDAGRRAVGIPPIDHGVYSDINGALLSGFVALYRAGKKPADLERAVGLADYFISTAWHENVATKSHYVLQAAPSDLVHNDDRMRKAVSNPALYLRPQAFFGRALVGLYRVTADPRWLEAAKEIAQSLQALSAPAGGYYASALTPAQKRLGALRPLEENAVAAEFLLALAVETHEALWQDQALRTLRFLGQPQVTKSAGLRAIAEIALAFEENAAGTLQVSVSGDRSDPVAKALYSAALATNDPRVAAHYDDRHQYPRGDKAKLFICTDSLCSAPVTEPARVAGVVAEFSQRIAPAACGG